MNGSLKARGPPPGPRPRAPQPAEGDSRFHTEADARAGRTQTAQSVTPPVGTAPQAYDRAQDQFGNAAVVRANGGDRADLRPPPEPVAEAAPAKPAVSERKREEHERRIADAASQLETPEAVPEPLPLPPMAVPPVPPLLWRPVTLRFFASATPELATDSWHDRDSKENRDIAAAARSADDGVRELAHGHHDEMANATNTAQQAIAIDFTAWRGRIESDFLRCDDDVSRAFDRALQTLREGADAADRLVLENYLGARDALGSASAQMKKAIKKNAETAAKQTDDIIEGLSKDFVTPLGDANTECTDKSQKTRTALDGFRAGIEKRYPLDGDAETAVKNEAKQGAARAGAEKALARLTAETTRISGRFTANVKQVGTDIRARVGPSLKAHAAKIEPEGNAAVDKAFATALAALKKNASEARAATAKTHAQVLDQLVELRAAERKRIEHDLASALSAARDEVDASCNTLVTTANATLPHYGDAVEQLHDSLEDSAPRGPQALASMTAGATQVAAVLDHSRDVQRTQIETVRAGVANGLAVREVRTREDNQASLTSAKRNFGESAQGTAADMTFVAQAMTDGLSALSTGVVAAAQDWIRPLATAFASFLADVKADLDRGKPSFLARVDTAKKDFITWLGPQSNPDKFFEADLNTVAIEAIGKVERIQHEVEASLSAGIIFRVNETRLGNALRPLTRLQGQLLRARWTKTWPSDFSEPLGRGMYYSVTGSKEYTLDGHLKAALGEGSDDYNAAINYLNGNTAEGARYELEASMHWYNDEEERMEGIMRGLTPSQLADLHKLKDYDATKRRVQHALDDTDLDVFNALDSGDQFKADAFRMRDELNAARVRNDKDAANEILAKYSRAPDYGEGAISAEQRRTGVQIAFAQIRGVDLSAKAAEMAKQREVDAAAKQRAMAGQAAPSVAAPAPAASATTSTAQAAPAPTAAAGTTTPAPTTPKVTAPGTPVPATTPPAPTAPAAAPTPAPDGKKPEKVPSSLADRWMTAAVAEPGAVVAPDAKKPAVSKEEAAAQALFEYSTRDITVLRSAGQGGVYEETLTFAGRDRDLARALIFHGEGSPEARAAQLGVEMVRDSKPDILKVDAALVDPRLNRDLPVRDPVAREQIRRRALEDRKRMLEIYARDYGGLPPGVKTDPAAVLIAQLDQAFGSDKAGSNLAAMLVRDEYPTPETASYALEYAMKGAGTNEDLIDRTLGRMNRDEIAEMRKKYRDRNNHDLYGDLGVFGHGNFGELSGDDRLRAERMLLGVPRNDKERAEVAAFAMQQQRKETGIIGGWLASGSLQDIALSEKEEELVKLVGGPITFGPDGEPQWSDTSKFKGNGFTGDAARFQASVAGAQMVAQNYSAKIDQYANAAAMGIAIIGAIVAAVVTVVTGGAASPLLMAAIAAITGLAAMGAQRLIKGGRYGWEEAITDLGMTAVSALTAGVGQALSLASRGGMAAVQAATKTGLSLSAARQLALRPGLLGQMGRLTGSAYLDKVLIGAATGGLSSFGQAALQEQTWKGGRGGPNLLGATFRGMLGGGVTASVTNAVEDMPLGRLSRFVGGKSNLGEAIGGSTNAIYRGLGKGITSSLGATAGRAAELGYDVARGERRMDSGDILVEAAQAGTMSLVQSIAEGSAEARAQAIYHARYGRKPPPEERAARIRSPETARTPAVGEEPATRAPAPEAPEAARPPVAPVEAERVTAPARTVTEAPALPRRMIVPEEELPRIAAPVPTAREPAAPEVALRALPTPAEAPARAPGLVLEKEGAAAAIPGTRMQLAEAPSAVTTKHLHDAVEAAVTRVTALAGSKVEPEGEGARIVTLKRADDTMVRVRVAFGDTGSNDVANFRPARREEGIDYVVTLSDRAHPELHARAVAHELAELRYHGIEAHAAPIDLLTAPAPRKGQARLSAHDVGRLAELEVMAGELASVRASAGAESHAARSLEEEIDALAAHLGLLHAKEKDPRFAAASSTLGEASAAYKALDEARKRATVVGVEDALQAARRIDESTRLSTADRKRLAELEELGGRIEYTREHPPIRVDGKPIRATARELELQAMDMMRGMGLLEPDVPSVQRARLALSVFEADSPGARLLASMRIYAPESGANDALRPGLTPDERTVASRRDLDNIDKLRTSLRRLTDAERVQGDPVEIARLRHEAEARAAAMGLVHGERAAEQRTRFMLAEASRSDATRFDDALAARLQQVRRSAKDSALLRPRFGTLGDLPLLARQIVEARSVGDSRLADRLTEIAAYRLPAEAFDPNPDVRARARAEVDRVVGTDPAARALADDALARHAERLNAQALRVEADSVRGTIARLESQLHEARKRANAEVESGRPLRVRQGGKIRRDIEVLQNYLGALESAAATAERVAFRPGGRTADEARAALGDPTFPTAPQFRSDPEFAGSGSQQALVRQMFGDSPMFQSWQRFREAWAEIHPSIRIGGTMTSERTTEWADLERTFARWLPGRHVARDAPLGRFLPDLPIIRAGPGTAFEYRESITNTPVRLMPDAEVQVKDRRLTVTQAEAERRALVDDRNLLNARRLASHDATEQASLRKEMELISARINDVSEAMGEAAGLRFVADRLPGGLANAFIYRGPGVPDIVHIDPVTGRVTIIECKGGDATFASRNVSETLGRAARAEQTTPEYLRDLATEMIGPGKSAETQRIGQAILRALDDPRLPIDVFVVRQPLDTNNNRGAIEVTDYPVTSSGR